MLVSSDRIPQICVAVDGVQVHAAACKQCEVHLQPVCCVVQMVKSSVGADSAFVSESARICREIDSLDELVVVPDPSPEL